MEIALGVQFFHENIPTVAEKMVDTLFMRYRNEAVDIFNDYIEEVNNEWDKHGKPSMLGEHAEDINPEYVKLIVDRIQPIIDAKVNKSNRWVHIYISQYGDLEGRLNGNVNTRIWIRLKPM